MPTFKQLLQQDPLDLDAIGAHLNGLGHDERVTEVRQVPGGLQKKLFAATADAPALDLEYFVPAEKPDRQFVRHYGKNSLPVFSNFEKRFARPSKDSDVAWGFNFSPVQGLVGPGHFVLRDGPADNEMHVDYYSLPDEQIEGAPALAPNDKGISTLVYGNMIDVLHRVSDHVTIGRAVKKGKETPNYFLLCREA